MLVFVKLFFFGEKMIIKIKNGTKEFFYGLTIIFIFKPNKKTGCHHRIYDIVYKMYGNHKHNIEKKEKKHNIS